MKPPGSWPSLSSYQSVRWPLPHPRGNPGVSERQAGAPTSEAAAAPPQPGAPLQLRGARQLPHRAPHPEHRHDGSALSRAKSVSVRKAAAAWEAETGRGFRATPAPAPPLPLPALLLGGAGAQLRSRGSTFRAGTRGAPGAYAPGAASPRSPRGWPITSAGSLYRKSPTSLQTRAETAAGGAASPEEAAAPARLEPAGSPRGPGAPSRAACSRQCGAEPASAPAGRPSAGRRPR